MFYKFCTNQKIWFLWKKFWSHYVEKISNVNFYVLINPFFCSEVKLQNKVSLKFVSIPNLSIYVKVYFFYISRGIRTMILRLIHVLKRWRKICTTCLEILFIRVNSQRWPSWLWWLAILLAGQRWELLK